MISFKEKSIVILSHLDDEFALIPILTKLSNNSDIEKIKFLYCCERMREKQRRFLKRREENLQALKAFNISRKQIIYLNDYYFSNDLEISKNHQIIFNYINKLHKNFKFSQILTLAYEGGHPDHDSLALIVEKFAKNKKVKTYFFPAYNYERNFFIPFTILKPLKSQKHLFRYIRISKFCWMKSIKLALIYKSEYEAFIKLIPFLIYNSFFIDGIYISDKIELDTVDWAKSLCNKRYKKTIKISRNLA